MDLETESESENESEAGTMVPCLYLKPVPWYLAYIDALKRIEYEQTFVFGELSETAVRIRFVFPLRECSRTFANTVPGR